MKLAFWQAIYDVLEAVQEWIYRRYILPHYPDLKKIDEPGFIKECLQQQQTAAQEKTYLYLNPCNGVLTEFREPLGDVKAYDA